jgi:hypothetical protein
MSTTKADRGVQWADLHYHAALPVASEPEYAGGFTCDVCQAVCAEGPFYHSPKTGTDACICCAVKAGMHGAGALGRRPPDEPIGGTGTSTKGNPSQCLSTLDLAEKKKKKGSAVVAGKSTRHGPLAQSVTPVVVQRNVPVLVLRQEEFLRCFGGTPLDPPSFSSLATDTAFVPRQLAVPAGARISAGLLGRVVFPGPLSSLLSSKSSLSSCDGSLQRRCADASRTASLVPLSSLMDQLGDSPPPSEEATGSLNASSISLASTTGDAQGKEICTKKNLTKTKRHQLNIRCRGPIVECTDLAQVLGMAPSSSSSLFCAPCSGIPSSIPGGAAASSPSSSRCFVFVPSFGRLGSAAATSKLSLIQRKIASAILTCVESVQRNILGGDADCLMLPSAALVAAFSRVEGGGKPPLRCVESTGGAAAVASRKRLRESHDEQCHGPVTEPTWELVGLCVGRELSSAVRAHVEEVSDDKLDEMHLQRWASEITEIGDVQCTGVIAGVQLIWVSDRFHRQGIATSLVDSLRRNVVYGTVVPPQQVAFSQPTKLGKLFAQRYAHRRDFLVFE